MTEKKEQYIRHPNKIFEDKVDGREVINLAEWRMSQSKNLHREMLFFREKSVYLEEQRKCHVLEAAITTVGKDNAHKVQETVRLIQSFY